MDYKHLLYYFESVLNERHRFRTDINDQTNNQSAITTGFTTIRARELGTIVIAGATRLSEDCLKMVLCVSCEW